ncbi:MAG: AAA family ATPase [Armatimonadota bacterium]
MSVSPSPSTTRSRRSRTAQPRPAEAEPAVVPAATGYLARLGAYGFDAFEPILLAALVTEDPLLLVGECGTGKTFLLNSISVALELAHRHYNAALVSFDDLVGFPYPDDEKATVRFLETPATVWGAESVLVDEISRCRPEHQNRLFSLIHERRVQGVPLARLRYRWAAMNPSSIDQCGDYAGSEALDHALADRFSLIVPVGDWSTLSAADQRRVADPAGEGARADDQGALRSALAVWRATYFERLAHCPEGILEYACAVASVLADARIRISPRRVRMLSRSLLAASVVSGGEIVEAVFRQVLACSLPQVAWGAEPPAEVVSAAHRSAWDLVFATGDRKWVHQFHIQRTLAAKARMLFHGCPSADAGGAAITQFLVSESPARAAAFALALYPAAAAGQIPGAGAESVADLGRVAQPILDIDETLEWQEPLNATGTAHPGITRVAPVLDRLHGGRLARANQLLHHCVLRGIVPDSVEALEAEFNDCVRAVADEISR